jgi:hypothetical protein
MSLLWKLVHETEGYRYEQHRLTGRRRAAAKDGVPPKRAPHHKGWLNGGEFAGFTPTSARPPKRVRKPSKTHAELGAVL